MKNYPPLRIDANQTEEQKNVFREIQTSNSGDTEMEQLLARRFIRIIAAIAVDLEIKKRQEFNVDIK